MAIYSVNEIVEFAVQIEQNGYAFYNEASKRKGLDPQAKQFIEFLRDQELDHEKTFLALRDEIDNQELELTQDWELIAQYLKSIIDGRIFDSKDSAIAKAASAQNIREVVDYAIAFEKDTLLYFHAIMDSIELPKSRQALRRIIHEEASHVLRLNDFKKTLA